jgi:hypothetical protein
MKALIFSNDQTVRLAETIDDKMLVSILKGSARLSYYAHSLSKKDFPLFCQLFSNERGLKQMRIKKFRSSSDRNVFYAARIETMQDNAVCVRGCSLSGIMAALSEKTAHDLITMEFGQQYNHSTQRLLRTSSQLSAISMIMDHNFVPSKRIKTNDITPCSASRFADFS